MQGDKSKEQHSIKKKNPKQTAGIPAKFSLGCHVASSGSCILQKLTQSDKPKILCGFYLFIFL